MAPGFPPSFSDIGTWHLMIYISETGMSAFLKNHEEQTQPPVNLFETSWKFSEESLKHNIETAVYDNPRLLDDYATEIIIQSRKTLQVPTSIIDENEGADETLFCNIFSVEPDDIFSDLNGEETTIYSLAPGLPAFLRRTLPGAKVKSHLSCLINYLRNRTSDKIRIYCDVRKDEVDLIAFNGTNLISAATQEWSTPDDISYRILLLIQAYDLTAENVEIYLSGQKDGKIESAGRLRDLSLSVSLTAMPSAHNVNLPTAGQIALNRI